MFISIVFNAVVLGGGATVLASVFVKNLEKKKYYILAAIALELLAITIKLVYVNI